MISANRTGKSKRYLRETPSGQPHRAKGEFTQSDEHIVPTVRRYEQSGRLVGHARGAAAFLVFGITVVLNVIIENSLYKSKEPLPDNREAVAGLNLVVRNAMDCSRRLCLWTLQHLFGRADDLGKARPRATQTIDGLSRSELYYTAHTDGSACSFEVEQQKYQRACRYCCMVHERLGVE